jgi:hypothetical protein
MDIWESIPDSVSRRKLVAFQPQDHPRGGNPENKGEFSKTPGSGIAPGTLLNPPSHRKSPEERGDVYGKPLPKGKYDEGDPRNDEEYERIDKIKGSLTHRYVGVTRRSIADAIAKGLPDDKIKDLLVKYHQVKEDRDKGLGGETEELYDRIPDPVTGANNVYLPSRRKLHQQIVDNIVNQAKSVPNDAKMIVLAGPSGAGKSTFLKNHGEKLGVKWEKGPDGKSVPSNYVILNPDDLKDLLPTEDKRYPGLEPNERAAVVHEESSYLTKMAIRTLMSQGKNVILDVTLADAEKGVKNYLDPGGNKYQATVALVNGDVKASLHNAGLRYKAVDKETGERTYKGRYLEMGVVGTQKPTKEGYRSKNAEQFEEFISDPRVTKSFVYDPRDPDKGMTEVRPGSSSLKSTSGMISIGGKMTTEITAKIRAFHDGQLSREALVKYLSQDAQYRPQAQGPYDYGQPERHYWVEGGVPYEAGTWDEVELAHDQGLLPRDVFNEVADIVSKRAHS